MIRIFSKKAGLTLIETLISSVIITVMILSSVNLMSRVYRYITSAALKTQSLNIASETVDLLRQQGFSGLKVTPDSMLPEPLSNLDQSGNPWPIEYVEVKTNTFSVYKIIQWAKEDPDSSIEAVKESDMNAYDDYNLKQIKVIVAYRSDNMIKRTELTGLIANREVPIAGSSISGRIYKKKTGGQSEPPGQASNATVFVVGHPEYTSRQYDTSGNYKMLNVMPGSYMLYATGIGFQLTYYTGNPVVLTDTVQDITGIDFLCPAVDVASVSGNVYIPVLLTPPSNTPTPTGPTPTPVCTTVILSATGSMTGKTSTYNNPTNISVADNFSASINRNNRLLYSEFEDLALPPNSTITNVTFYMSQSSTVVTASDYYKLSFTNDSGTNWSNGSGLWNTTQTIVATPAMSTSLTTISLNITPFYTTWDESKLNSLGMLITSNGSSSNPADFKLNTIDYAYIVVSYCVNSSSPSGTPAVVSTPSAFQCVNGAIVRSIDGLSLPDTSASCKYQIENIDVSSNTTTIACTYSYGGKSYYKLLTGVPVTADTTTFLNIYLEETTGTSIVNGAVYDAVNRTVPIVGANVYLSDPQAISPTTTGGGLYTINPADLGSWKLDATFPGYKIEKVETLSVIAGINNAPALYMYQVGNVTGQITDTTTGNPVPDIPVRLVNNTGKVLGETFSTSTGYYLLEDIPIGAGYQVQLPNIDYLGYDIDYPLAKYHANVTVLQGVTTSNKNFRISKKYATIKGKVTIDSVDIKDGLLIMAYPSSVTQHAHDYRENITNPAYLKYYTGRNRVVYNSYGLVSQRNSGFEVQVPLGTNYDIYAYYSYISYTGTPQKPVKTLYKYYKSRTNVTPGTTGQDISGPLSSWTAY